MTHLGRCPVLTHPSDFEEGQEQCLETRRHVVKTIMPYRANGPLVTQVMYKLHHLSNLAELASITREKSFFTLLLDKSYIVF